MFYRSLFVLLSFFFWSLCCLSFFNLRILITPWVFTILITPWVFTDSDYPLGIFRFFLAFFINGQHNFIYSSQLIKPNIKMSTGIYRQPNI